MVQLELERELGVPLLQVVQDGVDVADEVAGPLGRDAVDQVQDGAGDLGQLDVGDELLRVHEVLVRHLVRGQRHVDVLVLDHHRVPQLRAAQPVERVHRPPHPPPVLDLRRVRRRVVRDVPVQAQRQAEPECEAGVRVCGVLPV